MAQKKFFLSEKIRIIRCVDGIDLMGERSLS